MVLITLPTLAIGATTAIGTITGVYGTIMGVRYLTEATKPTVKCYIYIFFHWLFNFP